MEDMLPACPQGDWPSVDTGSYAYIDQVLQAYGFGPEFIQ